LAVTYTTHFGSLDSYDKGRVEVIDDDPKRYLFSNIFEVASRSKPYEKVAVAKNLQYVLEAIRAEGTSEWRVANHDEAAVVLDGEVMIRFVKAAADQIPADGVEGSVALDGPLSGPAMGTVVARRGHMVLLAAGAAYQFEAARPGVILQQAIFGEGTVERWAEIIQTSV
jgi:hypothetical protein